MGVSRWSPLAHFDIAFVAWSAAIMLSALEPRFSVRFAGAGVLAYTLGRRLLLEQADTADLPFWRNYLASAAVDEAIVRAARETVGPDALLMVDAGASDAYWPHGYKWALRTASMLAAYDVSWFEEALAPDAIEDYVELRRRAPVPIAGGEVLTRRQAFRPWLERRALDIVQPDVTKVGGLSEQRRIAWAAQEHDIGYVGHGWNTAIGLAADLQLAAALPTTELVEYKTGSPYIDALTVGGFALDADGMLAIPGGPGLGVELDPEAVERYTGKRDLLVA